MTLVNVVSRLSGDYKCEISSDAPLFHTAVREAHMEVVGEGRNDGSFVGSKRNRRHFSDLPNGGVRLDVEPKEAEYGERVVANCECPASSPAANFTWYIDGAKVRTRFLVRVFVSQFPGLSLSIFRLRQ